MNHRIMFLRMPEIWNSFSKNSVKRVLSYCVVSTFNTVLFWGRVKLRPCFNSTSFISFASSSLLAILSTMNWMNLESTRLSFSEIALLLNTSWREQGRRNNWGVSSFVMSADILVYISCYIKQEQWDRTIGIDQDLILPIQKQHLHPKEACHS